MLRIEKVSVYGFEEAIRGVRNAFQSWNKSDSEFKTVGDIECFLVGPKDDKMLRGLTIDGLQDSHSKGLRDIEVYFDVIAPLYWWAEFDTYKVGNDGFPSDAVVRLSCSTMHSLALHPFTLDDFSTERLLDVDEMKFMGEFGGFVPKSIMVTTLDCLNYFRRLYLDTQNDKYWWQMKQLLPNSYNMRSTVKINYTALRHIYKDRRFHKLPEWQTFCDWIEKLPMSDLITGIPSQLFEKPQGDGYKLAIISPYYTKRKFLEIGKDLSVFPFMDTDYDSNNFYTTRYVYTGTEKGEE